SRTRYLAFDPRNYNRLYAGIEVGGLLISDDAGKNWRAAGKTLTDPDVHEVLASRSEGLVLAACGDKAFRSRDRGESWEEITPAHDYGMSVAEDADGFVYLGSARGRPNTWIRESGADAAIYRSGSAGADWEPAIAGLGGGVMSMCAAPDGRGVIDGTSPPPDCRASPPSRQAPERRGSGRGHDVLQFVRHPLEGVRLVDEFVDP